ncbi:MAG: hypothetical protein U0183_18030 [Polyangiaceae bacterium]
MGASRAEKVVALAVLAGALAFGAPREARAADADDEDDSGMRAPTVFFGGRLTTTNVRTGKDDVSSYGALFVTSASFHGTRGRYGSLRGSFIGAIGSGTATVEGWLRGALTLGLRVPLGDPWSGFVRAGFGGELQGNGNYFFSRLELPITEVGVQLREGERLLELGARGAPVLAGRYHVEGARPRDLGVSPEYGAYFSARTPLLRSEISAMLIDKRDDAYARPVQVVRALVCGFGVVGALLVCGDGEVFRVPNGGATAPELGGTRVFYLGLTFGYGETFRPAGADE